MDFYSRQELARRRTRWLLLALAVAIGFVVLTLSYITLALVGSSSEAEQVYGPGSVLHPLSFAADNPELASMAVLFWFGLIMLASVYRSIGLREGGGAVARSVGATPVVRDTTDPAMRRLRNIVEEMAIASGITVPAVYVLEDEAAINAFAAGHSISTAAVTVTRGAIDQLSREELQGVVAHEFSHILNGDMRLNLRLMGWLYGLIVIALIGRFLLRFSPRGDRRGGALLLVGVAMMILGYLGSASGRIIQAAVCRSRERLADASAVQFTRNPSGLKNALLKIMGLAGQSRLVSVRAEEVAHMLFVAGRPRWLATHPPLAERIRALDPALRETDLPQLAATAARAVAALRAAEPVADRVVERAPVAALPALIALQVGDPGTLHVQEAGRLRLALPVELRDCVGGPPRARAFTLAVLASHDAAVHARQSALIEATLGAGVAAAVREAESITAGLPLLLRLPAVQHLFPALRRLPRSERIALLSLVGRLASEDREIDVFEFCLIRVVSAALFEDMEPSAPHGSRGLATSYRALGVLFSVLARFGNSDAAAAARAYEAGIAHVLPVRRPPYAVAADWPRALSSALTELGTLRPIAKRTLIEGLVATIAHDEQLNVAEAELLRTVCALLRCPLPPLLPQVEGPSRPAVPSETSPSPAT